MPHSGLGLHHFHRRIRIHQKHEPYPHPNKWINFMDKAVYVVGAIGPLMTLPQIIKIWFEKDAAGVSIVSWTGFLLYAIFLANLWNNAQRKANNFCIYSLGNSSSYCCNWDNNLWLKKIQKTFIIFYKYLHNG